MGTERPRYTVSVEPELFDKIEDYRFRGRYKTRSDATVDLIEKGLLLLSGGETHSETKKSPAPVMPETGESKSVRASLFYQQLIAAGYLREGEDFTTAQIRILKSVLEILDATFPKRNIPEGDEAREIG